MIPAYPLNRMRDLKMEEPALTNSHPNTRRHFLDLLLGASALGWLASVAYPVIRYLKPLPQTGPTGPTHLTREEAAKLEQNKFVIVPVSGQRVIVLQSPTNNCSPLAPSARTKVARLRISPANQFSGVPVMTAASI